MVEVKPAESFTNAQKTSQFEQILSEEFAKNNPDAAKIKMKRKSCYVMFSPQLDRKVEFFNIAQKTGIFSKDLLARIDHPRSSVPPVRGWSYEFNITMDAYAPTIMPFLESFSKKYEAASLGTVKIKTHF